MLTKINIYKYIILILILFFLALFIWGAYLRQPEKNLSIKFFDVGQGDSIFIRTPENYKILIDGGPNNEVTKYLEKELGFDRKIDLVVLTHPQSDHLYGLVEVLRRYKVARVLTSNVTHTTAIAKLFTDTLNSRKIDLAYTSAGESVTLTDQVRLEVLWPLSKDLTVTDLNEASIVIKLSYGEFDLLLTGDADAKNQPYSGEALEIEVLKVPHHGSSTGLKEDYLNQLSPEVSVISAGDNNRYGHPRAELLKMLHDSGSKIFRTDQQGTVEIVSDGKRWYTRTNGKSKGKN